MGVELGIVPQSEGLVDLEGRRKGEVRAGLGRESTGGPEAPPPSRSLPRLHLPLPPVAGQRAGGSQGNEFNWCRAGKVSLE